MLLFWTSLFWSSLVVKLSKSVQAKEVSSRAKCLQAGSPSDQPWLIRCPSSATTRWPARPSRKASLLHLLHSLKVKNKLQFQSYTFADGKNIIFGEFSWSKSVKTNFRIVGCVSKKIINGQKDPFNLVATQGHMPSKNQSVCV